MSKELATSEVLKSLELASPYNENNNDADDSDEAPSKKGGFCGFYQNNRILAILIFMTVGIAIGVGLSFWEPEDPEAKKVCIQWIGLAGDLFFRAIICFVIPLVFVNIIIAIVQMMSVGNASSIGWTVIALYLTTTVAAAFFGSMSTLIFMRWYKIDESIAETLAEEPTVADVTISDTVYEGIFLAVVPKNIFKSFSEGDFTAIMFFAAVFGAALFPEVGREGSKLMEILKEMDKVFTRVIRWIIFTTPFAVLSLIAAEFGKQNDLAHMFSNIGLLLAASFLGWALQIGVVYIGLFTFLTRSNPFVYLKHIIPAQMVAFVTASSACTIPTSLEAVKSTGRVPDVIGRFVIPFGAIVNMDGSAVYFACACIWLAVLNGEEITAVSFIILIIICTMGSIGTAPVPSAGLVLILTAYHTVFGGEGTVPTGFGYIFAIDWFMDRMQTMGNITGDCMLAGIVAHRCSLDGEDALTATADIAAEASSSEEVDEKEDAAV